MNFFMLWINDKGEKELLTPPLDGTILPGVTRNSIISLVRDWKIAKVSESPVTMSQIIKASREKRLIEMFGAGTAAIVSPIKRVHFDGIDVHIPLDPSDPNSQAGPLTKRIADHIMGIQYGEIEHEWSVKI
jgi:branched-chain amino acid aminotransferase